MFIDWFTVSAQAINFLILVWLLKCFLYGPILRSVGEREKRVATQLREAEAKQAEARQECDDLQRKIAEFNRDHDVLLRKAADEAKTERQKLFEEARTESEAFRGKMQETLWNARHSLNRELAVRTQQEVIAIARKALADLAGASLEERMAALFVRRLRELSVEEKGRLGSLLRTSKSPALVRSAFELPIAQRALIEQNLKEALSLESPLRFETGPELVSGIELSTDGYKVAWSVADYLASLEKRVDKLFEEQHGTEARTE